MTRTAETTTEAHIVRIAVEAAYVAGLNGELGRDDYTDAESAAWLEGFWSQLAG